MQRAMPSSGSGNSSGYQRREYSMETGPAYPAAARAGRISFHGTTPLPVSPVSVPVPVPVLNETGRGTRDSRLVFR